MSVDISCNHTTGRAILFLTNGVSISVICEPISAHHNLIPGTIYSYFVKDPLIYTSPKILSVVNIGSNRTGTRSFPEIAS